jgi:type IV pilus assembly protein PilY1
LGDIIDSAPVFAWHENFGYAALQEGMSASPNYTTFIASKGNGSGGGYQGKGMLYVGANDGMLHGFDAASGTEVFGYVPHNVIPNLPALADPAYAHRFYVDQTPYVGDACVGSGPTSCTWMTVLVGTTGAGGQGVFALDVTNPETMGAGSSASAKLLWDLDGQGATSTMPTNTSGDPDLGYPIGKPVIARLNNGDWAAVFGNGYLSARGCAVLFIVRLSDGLVTKIDTSGISSASTCTATNINNSNGLGPVALADVDGNLTTDYVYAGDLQGNLWKFNLLTSVPSGTVSGGQLLFAASPGCAPAALNTCQPITSAPALGSALPGMTGTMVYFGTGRLFATGDLGTTSTQSFYAILDQGGTTTVSKSALVQQTIVDSGNTRTISGNAVVAPGWFANLPDSGERVTFSPLLLDGFVVFATEVPSSTSCTASGTGWIMAIPTTTTSLGMNNNFFLSNPGIAGLQATNGMPEGMSVVYDPTTKMDQLIVGETGGPQIALTKSIHVTGRISWHELVR